MAQVTKDVHQEVGRLLEYLSGEYEWAIERNATWSVGELESFIAEQSLRDEMLDDLNAYAALCRLSAEQRQAYDRLLLILETHRLLFERILAG